MGGKLDGKVAIVTGGGKGIGEAIVRRLAEEGCSIVVGGRDREAIERVAKDVGGIAVRADVAEETQVRQMVATCDAKFGRLDILVNNAGVPGTTTPIAEEDMALWDALYAVNVRGAMLCIKHAMPLLKRQRGCIVNMSSIAGKRSNPRRAAYGSSKHGMIGLTHAIAFEAGPFGVRVNAVCPGAVNTAMMRRIAAEKARFEGGDAADVMAATAAKNALRRLATPREVADAVVFLASDAASAITGVALTVDAGKL